MSSSSNRLTAGRRRVRRLPAGQATTVAPLLPLQAGPLYFLAACARQLPRAEAEVRRRGGEYLAVTVPADGCCGREFLMLSTVDLCSDPRCRQDHRAGPARVGEVAGLAAAARPGAVTMSAGW